MTKSNLKLIGRASALALVASMATSGAQADDELLDILGAGGGQPKAQGQKADESLMRRALLKSLGKLSAEQNIFVSFIDQNQFDKALYQWPSAFEGTSFAKSPTGRALNAFVLFKNGIQVTALEQLLMIDRPKDVDTYLLQAWREMAPDNATVWRRLIRRCGIKGGRMSLALALKFACEDVRFMQPLRLSKFVS